MKIVQILPELNEGGVERGTVELSRELVKKGVESVVISNGGKLVSQIVQDGGLHVKVDVCSKNPLTALYRIFKLYKAIKKLNPDILHVRSRVPAWMVFFANKALHVKVVSTVHGINSVNKYSAIMLKAQKIICVSSAIKEFILENYTIKNPENLVVIDRGIDINIFNEKNLDSTFIEAFKKEFSLGGKYIATTIGRVSHSKNYETFIEGIALAKKDIPNIVGVIVGGVRKNKLEYAQELKALAKRKNCAKNIIFTGSQTKIPEICHLSHIVVNTTPKMGNIARTLLESLALGTPVIMTTFKGLKSIVKDGENGFLIQTKSPQDLAKKLLLAKNTKFSNVANTLPENFTLNYMVEQNINIYKDLIKNMELKT